jgi:hypothetical protein
MCPRWCGLPHAQMHSYALRILLNEIVNAGRNNAEVEGFESLLTGDN